MQQLDLYQSFIHKSRYARYLEEECRRENWKETVDRYCTYLGEKVGVNLYDLGCYDYIFNTRCMPSMRALMTSGKALERDNIAAFNCAYVAIDHLKAFDEAFFVLLNGTGIGYSVERQFIAELPPISDSFYETDTCISVRDSKLGWAKALRELIALLYQGQIPKWDVSKVRPAGAVLKTFGGRASGSGPLVKLFQKVTGIIKNARGRRLHSIECHDIMCHIASAVVVGGVRRSAMISLSNLSDDRMRTAKSGDWYKLNGQRSLANNSACYTEKPEMFMFMKEWSSLYESKSGERGIFNRQASQKMVPERRDPNYAFGTNPSLRAGTRVFTEEFGLCSVEKLESKNFTVRNLHGEPAKAVCWKSSPNAQLYKLTLNGGEVVYATKEHKWPVVKNEQVTKYTTKELKPGMFLPRIKQTDFDHDGIGSYDEGKLMGFWYGDGHVTKRKDTGILQYGFTVSKTDPVKQTYLPLIKEMIGGEGCEHDSTIEFNNVSLKCRNFFDKFSVYDKTRITDEIFEDASGDFLNGLMQGYIDADGHYSKDKRLHICSNTSTLIKDFQTLFGFAGIYLNLSEQAYQKYKGANGKIYEKEFVKYSLRRAISLMGSGKPVKIQSIEKTSIYEPVWDVRVESDDHCFQIGSCITGNCSEIVLRSSQFCNLSEVVCRHDDNVKSIAEKVRIATILGTCQAALTDFRYLRSTWHKNTEEEALLGVSLTGIYDCKAVSHAKPEELQKLRDLSVKTNAEYANKIGINESTAITCVKPSGTVSQLVNSASGIHPRHNDYYIRRARNDKKDPLSDYMIELGVPYIEDPYNKDAWAFEFPMVVPKGAVTKKQISALEHLETWKNFALHWCDHKPSITCSVRMMNGCK